MLKWSKYTQFIGYPCMGSMSWQALSVGLLMVNILVYKLPRELTWQTIMLAISLIRNQLSFQVIVWSIKYGRLSQCLIKSKHTTILLHLRSFSLFWLSILYHINDTFMNIFFLNNTFKIQLLPMGIFFLTILIILYIFFFLLFKLHFIYLVLVLLSVFTS